MSRGAQVIVAGAGALGLTTALALADAGCRVTVCDPALGGVNASSVAAGMLAPVFETLLDAEGADDLGLLLAARDLWPVLAARAGVRLDRSGAMAVGADGWMDEIRIRAARHGLRLTEEGAPAMAGYNRGLVTRDDWRLGAAPAMSGLRAAAQAAGVEFRVEAATGVKDADWLVVATGAAQGLAPELSQLTAIKGQILRYAPAVNIGVTLRGDGVYATPGEEGVILGATMEPGRTDVEIDPPAFASMVAAGERLLPGLGGLAFRVSAGVRAATPDGLPMVGASSAPKVLLAVGARRNGWLLAPLVAQTIAACVTGREPGPYAARLNPARFGEAA